MPTTANKTKTNKLTVYLIKPEFSALEDIVDPTTRIQDIDGVGTFLFENSHTNIPNWVKGFFGSTLSEDLQIFTASARGMLIVPISLNNTIITFAVSFGVGRFLLKEGVAEERFGLKVVLNSTGEDGFRSIDKTTLGSVPKHSREQMSRDVAPSDFGIDIEQDLVGLVTARSNDQDFGKIITGRDALNLSVKVDVSNIVDFLKHCYERYLSDDYKVNFSWIDQISEVRNKLKEEELFSAVVGRINNNQLDKIWMAVPEVINWADIRGFRYLRAKQADLEDDLGIERFLESLDGRQLTIDELKDAPIYVISAQNDDTIMRWSAFRCVYAEIELEGKTYILNNGRWYEIASDFTQEVQRDFASVPDSTIALPDYISGDELEYNTTASGTLAGACCMDQKLINHGGGHNKIEFCDIFTNDKKIIHVKKYGGSSILSHLFAQGMVSGELFIGDEEFRRKLNVHLPRTHKLSNIRTRPNPSEYEVVYAIISKSTDPLDIPFFSKVSLRNSAKRLKTLGYNVSKKKIVKTATTMHL